MINHNMYVHIWLCQGMVDILQLVMGTVYLCCLGEDRINSVRPILYILPTSQHSSFRLKYYAFYCRFKKKKQQNKQGGNWFNVFILLSQVHVFGYGADENGNWSHYFEELKNKHLKTGLHPGSHEYDIIQQLAERKTLSFYRGR